MSCVNCGAEIKTGVLCPPCDAVVTIRIHFESFVTSPQELTRLLDDLDRHGVQTAQRMAELASSRNAPQMAVLSRKCIIIEQQHQDSFPRALKLMRRPSKPVEMRSIAEAVGAALESTKEEA